MELSLSLDGWDIGAFDAIDWQPWGGEGRARAKVLASGDGYMLTLVEAEPGYRGTPHEHPYTEFSYVIHGELRNQGRVMRKGDGYVAAAGSTHTDFQTETGATYLVVFRI
jgi:quercetin dioxygenase-like cupin family protein